MRVWRSTFLRLAGSGMAHFRAATPRPEVPVRGTQWRAFYALRPFGDRMILLNAGAICTPEPLRQVSCDLPRVQPIY
jgi:hypothetical protein